MSFAEHVFPYSLLKETDGSVSAASGPIGPETPAQQCFSDQPLFESEQQSTDSPESPTISIHSALKFDRLPKTSLPMPIAGGSPDTPTASEESNYNKEQFWWWRDLSQDGRKLYEILIGEGGDWDILPEYADQAGFNLNTALDELREWGFLDESDPRRVRLVSRNL